MKKNRKKEKIKEENKPKKGEIKELSDEEYKELYRNFRTKQCALIQKGYAVYNYSLDEFIDLYNEERRYRSKLTKEEKKKKQSVMATVVNSSKIYTWKMAKIMAEVEGISTKEWKKQTIAKAYTGESLRPEDINEKEAVKVRQAVFDHYLAQTGDYDIAHAEYMTTV